MATDDDILLGPVPSPDDEPTAAERAHAKTFAELVDKTFTGRTPPAMSADDRALLDVATVIRAASGGMPLAPSTQRSIVEDALRKAIGEPVGSTAELPSAPRQQVRPIGSARRRWVPWAIAATSTLVAVAAVLLLWIRTPAHVQVQQPAAASLPSTWKSRPTDPLIGPIARERAGDAASRIDYIFADRLDGFRDRTLGGRR
ncbi:MAG: hypothetical protein H0T79_03365 [Deltaproteobacteria bacterium]|nr:hypothetical protein [Deltaproteobacteria bacterium]